MKKLVFLVVAGLMLGGCMQNSSVKNESMAMSAKSAESAKNTEIVNFVGENSAIKVKLVSNDSFETAVMTSSLNDKIYKMQRKESGDGIYMEDANGANIHFKNDYAIVEFEKFKSISLNVVK